MRRSTRASWCRSISTEAACPSPLPCSISSISAAGSGEWQGSPWSDLDLRVGGMLRGEPVVDAPAAEVRGPALQGLGRTAWLGWAAILVAALTAGAVGATATGRLSGAAFEGLALAALVLALLLLAATAFLLLRISAASRR